MAEPRRGLGRIVRARKDEILAAWTKRVRELLPASTRLVILDEVPSVLGCIADVIESGDGTDRAALRDALSNHVVDRLARGFDLGQLVREYGLLRGSIIEALRRETEAPGALEDVRALDDTLDSVIEASVERFVRSREHIFETLDRITEAAFEAPDLDEFLERLLRIAVDAIESADAASLVLYEGGDPRVRAAVGIDDVRWEDAGLSAVSSVRLSEGPTTLGVVRFGSRSAEEFSPEDQLLFRSISRRASAAIVRSRLLDAQRRAAAGLAEAEELSRLAIEASDLGTWDWRPDGPGLRCSDAFARIVGAPPGTTVSSAWLRERLDPEELPAIQAAFARAADPAGSGRFEVDCRFRRGGDEATRWVVARGQMHFDDQRRPVRLLGTLRDVTVRRRQSDAVRFLSDATAALSSSLEYGVAFERIAQLAVPALADWCSVSLVMPDGKVQLVAVAHVDPDELAFAKKLGDRAPPDPTAGLDPAAVVRDRRSVLCVDGLTSYMVVPMVARDRAFGAIAFASADRGYRYGESDLDVAEQLAQRAALAIDNARLYDESRTAIRSREHVLAIVSHDLRSPLGAVMMAADLLHSALARDGATDRGDQLRKYVDTIRRSSGRMAHLIGDLLDAVGIQSGRLAVEPRDEAIGSIVEEALENQGPSAAEKRISLRADLGGTDPSTLVRVDRTRVLQVFANLIGNAVKFCRPGEDVRVRADVRAGDVVFAVEDSGPGIPADELQHIFDPYWSAGRHQQRGTGLGLAISKGIVAAHGGRLWAESVVGVGTTFFFSVPRATAQPSDRSARAPLAGS